MALCRTCRQERSAALTPVRPPDRQRENEHPAVLLLRAWHQDDDVRCRLLFVTGPSTPRRVATAAQGVDAICEAVRRWLLQV